MTFQCWPRFADVTHGDKAQFPGWPITVSMDDNDGRKPVAWLPELVVTGAEDLVVQVIDEKTGEVLYTIRVPGPSYQPAVFAPGIYTVKIGRDRPDRATFKGLKAGPKEDAGKRNVRL